MLRGALKEEKIWGSEDGFGHVFRHDGSEDLRKMS